MVDISLLDPTTLTNILLIAISGTLICLGVHFVPVGGAPAAMAQATGIGTGTVELAAGSGLVGLITGAYMYANVENAPMALSTCSRSDGFHDNDLKCNDRCYFSICIMALECLLLQHRLKKIQ